MHFGKTLHMRIHPSSLKILVPKKKGFKTQL